MFRYKVDFRTVLGILFKSPNMFSGPSTQAAAIRFLAGPHATLDAARYIAIQKIVFAYPQLLPCVDELSVIHRYAPHTDTAAQIRAWKKTCGIPEEDYFVTIPVQDRTESMKLKNETLATKEADRRKKSEW